MGLKFQNIKSELIQKYGTLGHEISDEWEAIGKAPHIAPMAWLHRFYKGLSDTELVEMESQVKMKVPLVLREFYKWSNGLEFFNDVFSISGYVSLLRREVGHWQPFPIVNDSLERPKNTNPNQFYFGGWSWDGSKAYIDVESGEIFRCLRKDATPVNKWNNFEEFLYSEHKRLCSIHDLEGKRFDLNKPTIPI